MSASDSKLYTAEEVYSLEFDQPTELVKGEIVEMVRPGARHGLVCVNIAFQLRSWSKSGHSGVVISNDSGVITERDPDTVRGPDVYYIRSDRLPEGKVPTGWIEAPPDLCVEVFSPSDRWNEVLVKVNEYLSMGVPEVWVIDPDKQSVYVFRQDSAPAIVSLGEELNSPVLTGFVCRVDDFFAET